MSRSNGFDLLFFFETVCRELASAIEFATVSLRTLPFVAVAAFARIFLGLLSPAPFVGEVYWLGQPLRTIFLQGYGESSCRKSFVAFLPCPHSSPLIATSKARVIVGQ